MTWPIRAVEDFADVQLGKMLDKAKNRGTFRPYLRNLNVRWFGFDLSDVLEMRVTDDEFERYTIRYGDLVVCEGGYPGRGAIWTGEPVCYQKALHRVRCADPVTNRWLLYWLHLGDVDGWLADHFTGAGIQHFTRQAFLKLRVPLPPLAEQRRIVAILDAALEGIDIALADAEQNLANARALFPTFLRNVFEQSKSFRGRAADAITRATTSSSAEGMDTSRDDVTRMTRTGGRAATERVIPGPLSLSVGLPPIAPRDGWRWSALTSLARMESGHTPSRAHPEYWDGDVPWIGIKDAKAFHGGVIEETLQNTNALGIQNSSARILPAGTVCFSRTASVGYVTVMGRPMATSQDFVNWVCGDELDPHFLRLLFLAQGDEVFRFSSGAVHQTIYFPEAKAFHICHPSREEQANIVAHADDIAAAATALADQYERKLSLLGQLKQSILTKAFAGRLSAEADHLPEAAE